MFAPRLLVSPDLVPLTVLVGLAPARSARPGVPSRPQRQLQSGPADGTTQRDTCRIAQLEARAAIGRGVGSRYQRPAARTAFARSFADDHHGLPDRLHGLDKQVVDPVCTGFGIEHGTREIDRNKAVACL